MSDFGITVLVWSAAALAVASIILTAIIVLRLEHDRWPHGRDRVCPDPRCPCWKSTARKLTKNGPLL